VTCAIELAKLGWSECKILVDPSISGEVRFRIPGVRISKFILASGVSSNYCTGDCMTDLLSDIGFNIDLGLPDCQLEIHGEETRKRLF